MFLQNIQSEEAPRQQNNTHMDFNYFSRVWTIRNRNNAPAASRKGNKNIKKMIVHHVWLNLMEEGACGRSPTRQKRSSPDYRNTSQDFTGPYRSSQEFIGITLNSINSIDFQSNCKNMQSVRFCSTYHLGPPKGLWIQSKQMFGSIKEK